MSVPKHVPETFQEDFKQGNQHLIEIRPLVCSVLLILPCERSEETNIWLTLELPYFMNI
jgi:hypothetical protein